MSATENTPAVSIPARYIPNDQQRQDLARDAIADSRRRLSEIIDGFGPGRDADLERFTAEAARYAYLRWPEAFER